MTQFDSSTPSVTVGIPFTDQPVHQLANAVKSVFAQTHRQWRLLLVGDRPSRENLEFAQSISDARVTVRAFTERAGLARRLNDITAMTDTDYLFRMDGDDLMHPERLARQLRVLQSGEADLVGSRAYLMDGSDHIYGLMKEPPQVPPVSHQYLANSPILMHPTLAASTEWFRTHPYDESMICCEDKVLFITAASSTRMLKLPDPLLFYRVMRPMSSSRRGKVSKYDRIVARKYGHLVTSRRIALGYIVKSHIKQRTFQLLSEFGGESYLFNRKIDPLDAGSLRQAEVVRRAILTAQIPGCPVLENASPGA